MVRRLAPVRMPDGSDEALKECPFVVGHQIACQGHLPRRDDLESQPDAQGNPFCQHNLSTLRTEISGLSDPDAVIQTVKAWFDTPSGYTSTIYNGGPEQNRISVSAVDRIWAGPTANDQAFRSILASFSIAALVNDGSLAMSNETRASLAQKAGEEMAAAQGEIISLGAKIGITEKQIQVAQTRNSDALFEYEKIQAQLVGNDPERNVVELQAAQTNLETLYTITARLSQLSLTKLLR